ncbi:MAG: peptidoglycan-binding protein [Hyphomicrobiales bacterium]|nr:peptidoglycan-binding protein [Hyphomicrobiales bacterium]MBV9906013.1 peptidoglycan-binding protein [Hyphomicrobiales bacterium]
MGIRDLEWGMSGPDVKAIQEALDLQPGLKSPRLDHNGIFGPKTDAKVREFQALKHIPVTGRVGAQTRRALFPVGVATVTIIGIKRPPPAFRQPLTDRYPSVMPGKLTPPSRGQPIDLDAVKRNVDNPGGIHDGAMVKIPGAPQPLFARILPDHILGFDYDHMELVPGGQVTLPGASQFRSHQDAFSLTLQSVYQRGPDDGPNKTLTWGANFTVPETWFGGDPGPWTLAPFIQLTDVDRFWHVGNWHFWQPYAQVGAQFNLGRPVQPSATGALFPVNIGYDLNEDVTFQFASGLTFTLDVSSGQLTAARQASFGVSIKFGKPKK